MGLRCSKEESGSAREAPPQTAAKVKNTLKHMGWVTLYLLPRERAYRIYMIISDLPPTFRLEFGN